MCVRTLANHIEVTQTLAIIRESYGTKVDPPLKSLHKDPRYAAFLKKLNLPN
jgi:hypothetical protein